MELCGTTLRAEIDRGSFAATAAAWFGQLLAG